MKSILVEGKKYEIICPKEMSNLGVVQHGCVRCDLSLLLHHISWAVERTRVQYKVISANKHDTLLVRAITI